MLGALAAWGLLYSLLPGGGACAGSSEGGRITFPLGSKAVPHGLTAVTQLDFCPREGNTLTATTPFGWGGGCTFIFKSLY